LRICELKNKEVINICDGKVLGFVADVDFDIHKGIICAIIVPSACRFFSFGCKENDYIIPFDKIECIGPDAILVRIRRD
jgi:YlmC/YmxH family sporulation protein